MLPRAYLWVRRKESLHQIILLFKFQYITQTHGQTVNDNTKTGYLDHIV